MATVTRQICDLCGKEDGVEQVNISRGESYVGDICQRCWDTRLGKLVEALRRTRSKRPAARFKKTPLPPQP